MIIKTNEEEEENEKEKLEKQVEELTLSLQMEKMARVNMKITAFTLFFIFTCIYNFDVALTK